MKSTIKVSITQNHKLLFDVQSAEAVTATAEERKLLEELKTLEMEEAGSFGPLPDSPGGGSKG